MELAGISLSVHFFFFFLLIFRVFLYFCRCEREFFNHFNEVMNMKKIFGVIALAMAFVFAVPAQAQLKFGVKAGLNVSKVSISGADLDSKNRTGFFVGPMAEFTLPIVGLGIDAALLYDNKSVKVESESKNLHYIDIPINVKYTIGLGSLASVYGATGPQFSYNIGNKKWYGVDLNDSDFSWNIGAGVKLLGHLQVGYNYNIALGNTAEFKETDAMGKIDKIKMKNNTHQISVAYMF